MDHISDPCLKRYVPMRQHCYPLPWNDTQGGLHMMTEAYAHVLLDALAGDERRKDLRRVYRYFMKNNRPAATYRQLSRWMLIEALKRFMYVLPPDRVAVLKEAITLGGNTPPTEGKAGC